MFSAMIADQIEQNARKHYLNRLAVQSVLAASYGDVLLALKANKNDLLANFKYNALEAFISKHGLTVYKDVSQIQAGDTVVIFWTYKEKGKTKTSTSSLRIIEPKDNGWIVSLAMYENWEEQFEAHKRFDSIEKKNFVVGVRQQVPPIMKKPQKFYFINFND